MNTPRRAASRGTVNPAVIVTGRSAALVRVAVGVLAVALAGAVGMLGLIVAVARKVVVPSRRPIDTKIVGVDTRAQTITLTRTPDTALPGRYGLFTTGQLPYLKLGPVLSEDDRTVTRKLLTHVDDGSQLDPEASFSGWYYDAPEQVHLPYRPELIATSLGPAPAWVFPGGDDWVLQIHGRGAQRAEALRAVPLFDALGFTTMVVSYRNDGEGPRSRNGTYGLGTTEWRDIDAAIGYARRHGAKRVILMGWSMGGAIALQTAERSANRGLLAGVVLESPVVDWRSVLGYQARANRIPRQVGDLALATLENEWSARAAGSDAISFDSLDMVAHAASLSVPVLILHSDDDGFVPADASHRLAEARPDLVTMDAFEVARHTKLWNYDQARWEQSIREWLAANDLLPQRDA